METPENNTISRSWCTLTKVVWVFLGVTDTVFFGKFTVKMDVIEIQQNLNVAPFTFFSEPHELRPIDFDPL